MKRICWTLQVRTDKLEEYREVHKIVWPEMQQALRETGWHNYSIFLRDDGLLIGYLETEDFDAAVAGMARREVNARWQAFMAPYTDANARPDESFVELEEYFHLA